MSGPIPYFHLVAAMCSMLALAMHTEAATQSRWVAAGDLAFDSNGVVTAWSKFGFARTNRPADAGEIRYAGSILRLENPAISQDRDAVVSSYQWSNCPALKLTIRNELSSERGAWLWRRKIEIIGPPTLKSDLTLSLDSWPCSEMKDAWLPLINGTGHVLATNALVGFRLAGKFPESAVPLALPMVSVPMALDGKRLLLAADPLFSTVFNSNRIEWTYPAKPGFENGREGRLLVTLIHQGGVEQSLDWFFRSVLPDIPAGPTWLHEIALVDFDYLSDGGHGWFNDIDALSAVLSHHDRTQAFFCMHGCYDFLGRYCYNQRAGKLDDEWTAFSNYESVRNAHAEGTIGGTRVPMGFAACKPLKMSLAEEHRRLRYARSRGFRAGLYFADGMNAGDGLPDFTPDRVLHWGGWQGPDSKGKSYIQNPLHPGVREFFLGYTSALLNEFGGDIDALVWDETFHIPCGTLGTEKWPGYADRAMMRLVRHVTHLVDEYNRQQGRHIALLTSDSLGASYDPPHKAPYALMAHGTYQDSWCQPQAWSHGIFANYRNVVWSCCWWPIDKWTWVDFGVRDFQAPVSISNGWGDDTGFSEMNPAQQKRVLELFDWRKKNLTRLKWFDQLPPEPR